jgi:hypothetical protein
MSGMLDITFSMMLGLTITFIIINANIVVGEATFDYRAETQVQETLIAMATLIESEFRNMGYGVEKDELDASGIILLAERNRIIFRADYNNNGQVDVIEYFLGDPADMAVMNDSIRVLHRRVNDGQVHGIGFVTKFNLRYFDFLNQEFTPGTNPGNVKMIEIEMEVQSPYSLYSGLYNPGDNQRHYATTLWRQTRLGSKNFITR